jgi:hypothetical protein
MANEISVRSALQIKGSQNNLVYQSQPTSFMANQNAPGGPVPGQLLVGIGGINVNFSPLTQPSMGRIMNLDEINFITYGIYDSVRARFFPLHEVLPGETYPFRISRFLHEDYPATGTGSVVTTSFVHIRASQAPCQVLLEVFQY